MTSPPTPLHDLAAHWARLYNLRRLLEVSAVVLAALIGVLALGVLATRVGFPPRAGLVGLVAFLLTSLAIAATALRRRLIDVATVAARMDRAHDLDDLLVTALAVERGDASGDTHLAATVHVDAMRIAPDLDMRGVGAVAWPWRAGVAALACLALSAGLQLGAPSWLAGVANASQLDDAATSDTATTTQKTATTASAQDPEAASLTERERTQLKEDAKTLDQLSRTGGLSEQTKEALERAREQLRRAAQEQASAREALEALTHAERNMGKARQQADAGKHLDPKALAKASTEELLDQFKRAAAARDEARMGALSRELANRLRRQTEQGEGASADESSVTPEQRRQLARLMREQSAPKEQQKGTPASSKKSPSSSSKRSLSESTRISIGRLAELLDKEDMQGAERELKRLARHGSARPETSEVARNMRSMGRRTEAMRRRQMQRMGGRPRHSTASTSPRPGDASGAGKGKGEGRGDGKGITPGEGRMPGQGMSGGGTGKSPGMASSPRASSAGSGVAEGITRAGAPAPTPGGGEGGAGDGRTVSGDAGAQEQWVQSQWNEGGGSIVRAIERVGRGEESVTEYRDIHATYESIAESSTEREGIPLSRRHYIRRYFEAIRPEAQGD